MTGKIIFKWFATALVVLVAWSGFTYYLEYRKDLQSGTDDVNHRLAESVLTPLSNNAQTFVPDRPKTSRKINISSDQYYGMVEYENNGDVYSKGSVAIYEIESNRELFRVYSDELAVGELSDSDQDLIYYQDYNFDGIKDFAINDGLKGCYNGPSYQVYLSKGEQFVLSDDFTKLFQGNCGLPELDPVKKEIITGTKSGCCWHEESRYIIENNVPKLVQIKTVESSQANSYITITTTIEKLINGQWTKRVINK